MSQFECTRGNSALRKLSNKIYYLIIAAVLLALWGGTAEKHNAHQAAVADMDGQRNW
ncbi:hypothetical protein AM571_PC00341 (plasmid) [Rhizobium etli 8C-3]|uniref:Uncharacterized protein n=1 Tax=Rhizobium etli 8C-3 TaxID=538025 RepID=A0A1L5PD07_RHIET|nr:hypothetical protein AM571_PC00341 [Rhizobium etli 8C-3]